MTESPKDAPLPTGAYDEEFTSKLQSLMDAAIEKATLEKFKDGLKSTLDQLIEDHEFWVKEEAGYWLTQHVSDLADRAICSLLEGNEEMMRRYIWCQGYTGRDMEHRIRDSKIAEYGGMELRAKIVEAFPELLKNERILDLESHIRSLIEQNQRLETRCQEYIDRLNTHYRGEGAVR